MKIKWLSATAVLAIIIAGLLYAGSISADTPSANNAEATYEAAGTATFYLRVLNEDGEASAAGTGVILSSDGTAATAYHVVKGAERMEGVMADGTILSPIRVGKYDEVKDVAVLQLPSPSQIKLRNSKYPYLSLRQEPLKYGSKVFALGYPLKNTPIITEGIVNSPDAPINGRSRVLTSAQVVSGMSGGPLLDERGRLAGIISGSLRTMDNIHLVVNADDLRSLLPVSLQ